MRLGYVARQFAPILFACVQNSRVFRRNTGGDSLLDWNSLVRLCRFLVFDSPRIRGNRRSICWKSSTLQNPNCSPGEVVPLSVSSPVSKDSTMDPEKTLEDLMEHIASAEQLVDSLHTWIHRGGFRPAGWSVQKWEALRRLRHVLSNLESSSAILADTCVGK